MKKKLKGLGMQAQEILELEEKAQALRESLHKQLIDMIGMEFEIQNKHYMPEYPFYFSHLGPEKLITLKIVDYKMDRFQILEDVEYGKYIYFDSIGLSKRLAKSKVKS